MYKYHAVSGHIHCDWQGIMQHTSLNFSALLLSYSFDIFLTCLTIPQSDPAHAQQQEDRDEIPNIMTDLPFCLTNSPHNSQQMNKKFSTCLTLPRTAFPSATTFPNHSPVFQTLPYFFFKTKLKAKRNFLSSKEIFLCMAFDQLHVVFFWPKHSSNIMTKDYRANSLRPNGHFYIVIHSLHVSFQANYQHCLFLKR